MNEPRFEIVTQDMGGWVRVFMGRGEPAGELARFLSHALTCWYRDNPHRRMVTVVPVSRDGDTMELHSWYTQSIFPDTSPMAGG